MGSIFGRMPNNAFWLYFRPDVTPDPFKEPTNNPQEGFTFERKRRLTTVCKSEMLSAKLPLQDRDYCSQQLLNYMACRKDVWPFPVFCTHEKHIFLNCKYQDYIHRMKDYERERRLMERKKRYDDFIAKTVVLEDEEEEDDEGDEEDEDEYDEDEIAIASHDNKCAQ